jgi:RNA polymerase sigma-70 factor (ECF subfamily)
MRNFGTISDMSERRAHALLSDDPTIELVRRARTGDCTAVEALIQRCLPSLMKWAHGRLPPGARGALDTGDLVQEAAMHAIAHLDTFEVRHVGAMQAYLRQSVTNRIIDEVRRVSRRPVSVELDEDVPFDGGSPLEIAIAAETYDRYRASLMGLKSRQREIVIARVEMQWSIADIEKRFGFPTLDAARIAVHRALKQLATGMQAIRGA